jgi:formylglycine-generating enzyme required for sulfatase activity
MALRRGEGLPAGTKVLIVIDQFEQWLHAKRDEENTELVQALRQCDGGRVQCIVMVRDDFWMAATGFMRALEIRLVEGHNSAAVDLFPLRHAEKVLAAFGRAFGALPEGAEGTTAIDNDQQAFIARALGGLAQEGKVICVRLALFAEMMKGKPWTPAAMKAVGGTEGVGATFLEETFSAATAPPEHRYHQKAARAVLQALLPESGTDIKGHMRSHAELLAASGYAARPKEFDLLLRILDSEVRLITPSDPVADVASVGASESPTPMSSASATEPRFYQLTHDYLVPSLRDWLTRKQKETCRGRAGLLLADRAAVWNVRPENRQLPSLLQWLQVQRWTAKRTWTPPQRKMMARATRYHAVRTLAVALVLVLAGWGGYETYGSVKAHGLRDRLLDANTNEVPAIVADMAPFRPWLGSLLRDAYQAAEANHDARKQLHASLALLPDDPGQVAYLHAQLLDADPHEVPVIRALLAPHQDALVEPLWTVAQAPAKDQERQRLRAAAALALYDPDSDRWATVQDAVADDLVAVPAVYLGTWLKSLRPVRKRLLPQLSRIYGEAARREAERSLATDILTDYAADDPPLLADLLMNGDAKQFTVLYPVANRAEGARALLADEIDKQPVAVPDKVVLEATGTIADDDAKVKVSARENRPAKRYEVALQAGQQYRITLDSSEIDSFLVLHDKAGKELGFDDGSGGNRNSLLIYQPAADGVYTVYAALKGNGAFALKIVATFSAEDAKEKLAKRQANAAVALLRMNQPGKVWPLLKHSRDPRVRSYLIHRFAPLGADAGTIIGRLATEPDITIRRALILSLGEYGERVGADARGALVPKLRGIYRSADDPGLRAAAEWLLRQWQDHDQLATVQEAAAKERDAREEQIRAKLAKGDKVPQWYVNGQKQTMVVLPGPIDFQMGTPATETGREGGPGGRIEMLHARHIGRSFAIAAKEVTVAEFRRFRKGHNYTKQYAPTDDCPVNLVSWYDAAAYCNWLSEQEGLGCCYEANAAGKFAEGMKVRPNHLQLTGYRLPTEAEWEHACRGDTATSRYFGETEELLGKYAWYTTNSLNRWMLPGGSLKPNDLGLFDMLGNAMEWCHDPIVHYTPGEDKENTFDKKSVSDRTSRALRGGSFNLRAVYVRCGLRYRNSPAYLYDVAGFRPARTFN